jgi:hypothetical protein
MKKITLLLLVIGLFTTASAKILRVNNIAGSTATYSTFDAAYTDAKAGDTIMVDSSPNSYGSITIKKKLVILGPGYWLVKNGIVQEGAANATFGDITISGEGTTIKGIYASDIIISTNNVTVMRCNVYCIYTKNDATRGVIHQNFIRTYVGNYNDYYTYAYNYQITNNIIKGGKIAYFKDSYIAYNTTTNNDNLCSRIENSTIEYNIYRGDDLTYNSSDNTTDNNKQITDSDIADLDVDNAIDSNYKEILGEITEYGAFAGDDPYVISGVPNGPVITDISTPTTVAKGEKLNVTINVSIQK